MTDREAIEAILNGNREAFREIVSRYESRVAATVIGMLGPSPEADDVGQETFIRFYNRLDKFRHESGVGTYLTRIAINLSLNEIRRRKRRSLFFSNHKDADLPEVADAQSGRGWDDRDEIVRRAIQKLDAPFRAVIVLRLIDGYSTEETARILEIPVGTVLSRLARAQKKLKVLLSPHIQEQV